MPQARTLRIPLTQSSSLEGRLYERGPELAIIAPPHPLYGGSIGNPVVRALEEAFGVLGLTTLAFNFRGTGESDGDPSDDFEHALTDFTAARQILHDRPLAFASGYSFGAVTALRAAPLLGAARALLVAPPVGMLLDTTRAPFENEVLAISGADDEYAPPDALREALASYPLLQLAIVKDAEHFFWGSGARRLTEALASLLSPTRAEITPEDVLSFWIGPLDADGMAEDAFARRWWTKDEEFDAEVRARFGALHSAITRGEHRDWLRTPRGRLAYVIVLDQFSRNMFRGSPLSFASDARALEVALEGISRGDDQKLVGHERTFMYLPLMHAESLPMQERCVALFRTFCEASTGRLQQALANNLEFAVRHRDIIAQWGRFPHRNPVLDRTSTADELEFLSQPGSSF